MIKKFDEEYKDLMVENSDSKRTLKTIDEEYTPYPKQEYNNRFLFLLSQKEPGFMAIYTLRIDTKKRLQTIKENLAKRPELLLNIETALKQYLPISYDEFNKLDIFKQEKMLKDIRNNLSDDEKYNFDKLFKDLSYSKTKELKINEN